jgi:predicted AAA+ superfamily ATPase
MITRPIWTDRIASSWRKAPIVWLAGPRRTGKTVIGQTLAEAEFLNCDLPSVAERLRDPETFYRGLQKPVVVFDEVHQLSDPSRLLKIGADQFPDLKILATGSSTLAATRKFRDSLTGRKRVVSLTPVLHEELPAFGINDVRTRLLRGGLPPMLLVKRLDSEFFSEWQDSYFARDVQELFNVEKRAGFLRVAVTAERRDARCHEALEREPDLSTHRNELAGGLPDHAGGPPASTVLRGWAAGDRGPAESLRLRHRPGLPRAGLGHSASG